MSLSSQDSPGKREWDQIRSDVHDILSEDPLSTPGKLSLLHPDVRFTDNRVDVEPLYQYNNMPVLGSNFTDQSANHYTTMNDEQNSFESNFSPRSEREIRMFQEAILSPPKGGTIYDVMSRNVSPYAHVTESPQINHTTVQQVPTSRDWYHSDQRTEINKDFELVQNSQSLPGFNHPYDSHAYGPYLQAINNPFPGMASLQSSDDRNDLTNNPYYLSNLKALEDRDKMIKQASQAGRAHLNNMKVNSDSRSKGDFSAIPRPANVASIGSSSNISTSSSGIPALNESKDYSSSGFKLTHKLTDKIKKEAIPDRVNGIAFSRSSPNISPNLSTQKKELLSNDNTSSKPIHSNDSKSSTLNVVGSIERKRKQSPLISSSSHYSSNNSMKGVTSGDLEVSAVATLTSIATPSSKSHSSGLPKGPSSGQLSSSAQKSQQNVTCNCKKSRCLKLYCDCFKIEKYCEGCNCNDCANLPSHEADRRQATSAILERNPNAFSSRISPVAAKHVAGCKCKKSSCLKKYCECFTGSVSCTDKCRCIDCKNTPDHFGGNMRVSTYKSNMHNSSLRGIAIDNEATRNRSNSWGQGGSGSYSKSALNLSNIVAPGSASTVSSISSSAFMNGLKIRSTNPSPRDRLKDENMRAKHATKRARTNDGETDGSSNHGGTEYSDDGEKEEEEEEEEEDENEDNPDVMYYEDSYDSYIANGIRANADINVEGLSSDMTANESSSTPLELDIDDINAAIKGRRSSPRNKSIYSSIARRESPTPSNKRTELSPSISRKPSTASFDDRYASPPRSRIPSDRLYSLSQMSSVSDILACANETISKDVSPPNSDEAKSTVSKLLELGSQLSVDEESRKRADREASESLLMLSPLRGSSTTSVVGDDASTQTGQTLQFLSETFTQTSLFGSTQDS